MTVYKVKGMTCAGCARAIERAIRKQVTGNPAVEVDLEKGEVQVGNDGDPQIVNFAIEGLGYQVEAVR
ncbi:MULTISPECIES: heavy-metal-associated domain-containing protein [Methylobacteriaceae]|jgi:copper chaperone|uniref:HMA domain-containing protein n=2 Tax=Methylobacteriaceae TaxID=119045 RepID=A0A564FSA2_9HYPH|nr:MULTISPECIES: heavy metal-associated domain-containing protein [Methylobacteriaceae]EHP92818.1 Heavy metal transport/detoxification protein [Methylorubrum extorquens DSM 13060]GJD54821.1 hypothetical protein IFDJLNFL_0700 [Methylobacterium dankookense]VUF11039.1 hypothetical protein MTDSW087_00712 [Methylobacterium dankookense]